MSDISELEGRLTTALDRIREAMARQDEVTTAQETAPVDDGQTAALLAQLDEERTANAQLEERVKALKERQDTTISALEAKAAQYHGQLATLDAEIQRLRASNADLRDVTAQLRTAASENAADAAMINRATLAELEALQAQRASEASEMDAIVTSLKPLIEEA